MTMIALLVFVCIQTLAPLAHANAAATGPRPLRLDLELLHADLMTFGHGQVDVVDRLGEFYLRARDEDEARDAFLLFRKHALRPEYLDALLKAFVSQPGLRGLTWTLFLEELHAQIARDPAVQSTETLRVLMQLPRFLISADDEPRLRELERWLKFVPLERAVAFVGSMVLAFPPRKFSQDYRRWEAMIAAFKKTSYPMAAFVRATYWWQMHAIQYRELRANPSPFANAVFTRATIHALEYGAVPHLNAIVDHLEHADFAEQLPLTLEDPEILFQLRRARFRVLKSEPVLAERLVQLFSQGAGPWQGTMSGEVIPFPKLPRNSNAPQGSLQD